MLQMVASLELKAEEVTATYGRFVAEPLERGMATTLGNGLRRVLLSNLPGAAITWVKIDGVLHEFSPLPHMKEDVLDFLLHVKGIRLRPLTSQPGKLYLSVEREGVVTAGDIQPSAQFNVMNPEHYLATLSSPEARLSVEFNVELSKGYLPAGKSDSLPTGVLPVDAIFSPVHQVNFKVAPTRVGPQAGYEKLTLEVWVDATLSPQEAVSQAASLLADALIPYQVLAQGPSPTSLTAPKVLVSPEKYNIPIEDLNFSVRTYHALKRGGISSLGQILEHSQNDLMNLRQFGPKALEEVRERLQAMGDWNEEATEAIKEEGGE